MIATVDPSGPWREHARRSQVIAAQAKIVWAVVGSLRNELVADAILVKEVRKVLRVPVWAATETIRSAKYKLRYVSEGVLNLCRAHGPIDRWAREGGQPPVQHEHVLTQAALKDRLLLAASLEQVQRILDGGEACVVTPHEHDRLAEADGSGWDRYVAKRIGVWDRKDQRWKVAPAAEQAVAADGLVPPFGRSEGRH